MTMEAVVMVTDSDSGEMPAALASKKDVVSREMSSPQFCRICFEDEQHTSLASTSYLSCLSWRPAVAANPLIRPCLCSGTAASVHLMCLWRWQAHSKSVVCELCKAPFEIPKGLGIPEQVGDAMDRQPLTGLYQDDTTGTSFLRKPALLSLYVILLLIPLTTMVLIVSFPLGQSWNGETELVPSWTLLMRVVLSLLVLAVYSVVIYCCFSKRCRLLNWMNNSQQRQRQRTLRDNMSHNAEWNQQHMGSRRPINLFNQDYHYMDVAFIL